jgi:hypothetical protein
MHFLCHPIIPCARISIDAKRKSFIGPVAHRNTLQDQSGFARVGMREDPHLSIPENYSQVYEPVRRCLDDIGGVIG